MKTLARLLFFAALSLLNPPSTQAQVILTELYPAPASGESEWVEIYNTSADQALDLSDWTIEDQLSSSSVIHTFESGFILDPQTTTVIQLTTTKLNNSEDGVTLYDHNHSQIDTFSYPNTQSQKSWSRFLTTPQTSNHSYWEISAPTPNQVQIAPSPSPSPSPLPSPSSSPSPTPTPSPSPQISPSPSPSPPPLGSLLITEVGSCPNTDQPEWIELFNTNSQTINLEGWRLIDGSGNQKTLSGSLDSQAYFQFSFSAGFLNNTGETLILLDSHNNTHQTFSLSSCQLKGGSWVKQDGTWIETDTPSPGSPNPTVATNTTTNQDTNITQDFLDNFIDPPFTSSNTSLTTLNSQPWVTAGSPLADFCDTQNCENPDYKTASSSAQLPNTTITSSTTNSSPPIEPEYQYPVTPKFAYVSVILGGLFLTLSSSLKLMQRWPHLVKKLNLKSSNPTPSSCPPNNLDLSAFSPSN